MSNNILRKAIQKVATGPEFSKNISVEDSYDSMMNILDNESDSIQAAIYLIAMRMKRETICLLYTSPSPRDRTRYRMPSSA